MSLISHFWDDYPVFFYLHLKSLYLSITPATHRFLLQVPNLKFISWDMTTWQDIRIVFLVLASWQHVLLCSNSASDYWKRVAAGSLLSVTRCLMGLLPDTKNCGLLMRRECRERFPRPRLQRKPLVSDPSMHHGTCVTHVPWSMLESLTRGRGENVSDNLGACGQPPILRIWQEVHGGN